MRICGDSAPSYQIRVDKVAEKPPFGEDDEQ
jgi:hypothetical protein